jgi:hypothetical protein
LEHPLLTELHSKLVRQGDYAATERLILNCLEQGFFSAFMRQGGFNGIFLLFQFNLVTGERKAADMILIEKL